MRKTFLSFLIFVFFVSVFGCTPANPKKNIDSPILGTLTALNFKLQPEPCKSFFPNTKCDLYEYQENGKPNQRIYINDDGSTVYFMFFNPSNINIVNQVKTRDLLFSQLYGRSIVNEITNLTNNFCPPNKNISCYTYGTVDSYYINFRLDTPYPLGITQVPQGWQPTFAYYEIYVGPQGKGCNWC